MIIKLFNETKYNFAEDVQYLAKIYYFTKGACMEKKIVAIRYYNVWFYLYVNSEQDMVKISYLTDRIDAREQVIMKVIYQWCKGHGIKYNTKFVYRKDFPLKANIWNFYSYIRSKIETRINIKRNNIRG